MRDLSRRFFHLLLRRGRLRKAFRLAEDLAEDYDLFMDLCHAAGSSNNQENKALAEAAAIRAKQVWHYIFSYYLFSIVGK